MYYIVYGSNEKYIRSNVRQSKIFCYDNSYIIADQYSYFQMINFSFYWFYATRYGGRSNFCDLYCYLHSNAFINRVSRCYHILILSFQTEVRTSSFWNVGFFYVNGIGPMLGRWKTLFLRCLKLHYVITYWWDWAEILIAKLYCI